MAITDLDEQLLVRAHQAGDEHAFGQIVRSQHRALYAHAYRRLGSHEAAEDAVQDTLLRAYRALPSFDGDLRLRAWLHRILTNVCHDESNRRKRAAGLIERIEAQPVELAPDPIEEAVLHDTVRVMNEALGQLPETYREALVLRYVDGLSFREVADATGVTEENARARVHRGRLALHRILSRVSMMVAFLVPGLRRGQKALAPGAESVAAGGGSSEPAISITTQLATQLTQAAPTLTRVAAEAAPLVTAKSSMVATGIAAVAAVSAPVVAYQVYETAKAPERPPAAVAAPAEDDDTLTAADGAPTTVAPLATAEDDPAASTSTSTSTTLPPSAAVPFAPGLEDDADDSSESPTTTSTTEAPPSEPAVEYVSASLRGDEVQLVGVRPDFDVNGVVAIERESEPSRTGSITGGLYVADAVGGEVSAELDLVLDDGTTYRVRLRGILDSEDASDGVTTWLASGRFSIPGGEEIGLAEAGDVSLMIQQRDNSSTLLIDLKGTASS